jgi:hypothetical protein
MGAIRFQEGTRACFLNSDDRKDKLRVDAPWIVVRELEQAKFAV